MNKHQPFAELRGIIHGWAFCNQTMLTNKLNRAERFISALPKDKQTEANTIIAPLYDALEKLLNEVRSDA